MSESGNYYKTDKGQVIKFNEGFFGDLGEEIVSKVRWEDKKWYYEFEDGEYGEEWPEDALAIDPDPECGYEKFDDIRTLLKKYPEFIKRAKAIFSKSKWKEYGVIDESRKFVK